jgi:hypothetical protein
LKRQRPAPGGTGNGAADRIGSSSDPKDKHPVASVQQAVAAAAERVAELREHLTATLRATGPGEAEGVLVGHAASPTVHSRRDGDRLHVRILLGEQTIGGGVLVLDFMDDPPAWSGEVTLGGASWWVSAAAGTGLFRFSHPRRPGSFPGDAGRG